MYKAISAIENLTTALDFTFKKGLSDEMEEDEDLHNKLKSSDQAKHVR